jgi:hypothetical protein
LAKIGFSAKNKCHIFVLRGNPVLKHHPNVLLNSAGGFDFGQPANFSNLAFLLFADYF